MTMNRRSVLAGLGITGISACQPKASPSTKSFDTEVIILGAGLSGLHAARLLTEEGYDVLVLEANERVGGRLYTLEHDSSYTEGGGEQIGASYARIRDTASSLNVDLIPDHNTPKQTGYWFKDKIFTSDQLKAQNPAAFPPPFIGTAPNHPLFSLAAKANPLNTADAWRESAFTRFDISAEAFLEDAGFDASSRQVIERALNGNSLSSYSMMNLYRSLQLFSQSRDMGISLLVKGGAQRLPEAMAASLPNSPILKTYIKSIDVSGNKIIATDHTGRQWRAPKMICTLPFGALRHLSINAALPTLQKTAIARLPYTQILQVHFRATSSFWEKDGLPADMWTHSPIERVFANRGTDGTPTGLFRCWINGDGIQMLYQNGAEGFHQRFRTELARLRPSTYSAIQILDVVNWTRHNRAAGGAYMHWAPNQISRWAETMGEPIGSLYFAGEHLGLLHTGMEAAMESAERAALRLMGV